MAGRKRLLAVLIMPTRMIVPAAAAAQAAPISFTFTKEMKDE